mgnify:CR=1 FL=1
MQDPADRAQQFGLGGAHPPVVRDADQKGIGAIATEVKDLAQETAREVYRYYYRLRYPFDADEWGRPKRLSLMLRQTSSKSSNRINSCTPA